MVYTPVKGTTMGGHFYTYDTMHLTELAYSFDNSHAPDGTKRVDYATNADHPSSARFLARMTLALPFLVKKRGDHPTSSEM
jgi:hypothetical protein